MTIPPVTSTRPNQEAPTTPSTTRRRFDENDSPVVARKVRRVTEGPDSPVFARVPAAPRKAANPNPHMNMPSPAHRVL